MTRRIINLGLPKISSDHRQPIHTYLFFLRQ